MLTTCVMLYQAVMRDREESAGEMAATLVMNATENAMLHWGDL